MIFRLQVCCNDEHGRFSGRAVGLQVLDMELEAQNWFRPPKFVELERAVRLAGKPWPVVNSIEWHGNWCWNAYDFGGRESGGWQAVSFLAWLRGRKLYRCTAGPSDLYDWFNDEREARRVDVHGWLLDSWAAGAGKP